MNTIASYLFLVVNWVFSFLPFSIIYLFSDFLYFIFFHVTGYRKKVIYENLINSFPEKSENEINLIAKKYYKHMCDVIMETSKLRHTSFEQLMKRNTIKNPELLNSLFDKGKSVIAVMGHYGNWEVFGNLCSLIKHKPLVVYKPLTDKIMNDYLNKNRSKFGVGIVPMAETYKTMINYQKQNILTLSVLIADQAPTYGESHYWTTFLNQESAFFIGAEKIAQKTNQSVVYFHVDKIKRGYYDVEVILLYEDSRNAAQFEIIEKYIKTLESKIIKKPEYWLWSHRRWKRKRKNNEA